MEISCEEVQQKISAGEDLLLLDCREEQEHALGVLPGARLLPMSQLTGRVEELASAREQPVIVYCHHGMRSAQVAAWLADQGFEHALSMAGGIDRWSEVIDPSVPRY